VPETFNIEDDLDTLTEQIGRLLPVIYSVPKAERDKVTLRQSFAVWTIDVDAIEFAAKDGSFPAHATDYHHHQIAIGESAAAYALSHLSSGSLQVCEVGMSPIAKQIEDAISLLPVDVTNDTVVRFLVIRTLGVYAFWLPPDRIHVISVPLHFKKLPPTQDLDTAGFLKNLAEELDKVSSKIIDKTQPVVLW
jgi:hypothetical protein